VSPLLQIPSLRDQITDHFPRLRHCRPPVRPAEQGFDAWDTIPDITTSTSDRFAEVGLSAYVVSLQEIPEADEGAFDVPSTKKGKIDQGSINDAGVEEGPWLGRRLEEPRRVASRSGRRRGDGAPGPQEVDIVIQAGSWVMKSTLSFLAKSGTREVEAGGVVGRWSENAGVWRSVWRIV
jgi:hypothetical protein